MKVEMTGGGREIRNIPIDVLGYDPRYAFDINEDIISGTLRKSKEGTRKPDTYSM